MKEFEVDLSGLDNNKLIELFINEFSRLRIGLKPDLFPPYRIYDERSGYSASNGFETCQYTKFINNLILKIKEKLPQLDSSDLQAINNKLLILQNRYTKGHNLRLSSTNGILEIPIFKNSPERNRERFPDFKTKGFLIDLLNIFSIPDFDRNIIESTSEDKFENDANYLWILWDFIEYHGPKLDDLIKAFQTEINLRGQNNEENISKNYPSLPDAFRDKEYFNKVLSFIKVSDLYTLYDNKTYHLKKGKKVYLAGLAQRLLDTGKLIDEIKTSQDLARVFCPFFHVKFNQNEEKQFQPDRAKVEYFDFIK